MTVLLLMTLLSTDPLLSATDELDPGATCIYTISVIQDIEYWVVLDLYQQDTDFDLVVASSDMDLDVFMELPYYEDFVLAREHAMAEGLQEGPEDLTFTPDYSGTAYLVIHDIGETGGQYDLKVY